MLSWPINNQKWMQYRKEEWLVIRNNLERTGLTVKEIKSIERYYLKGLKPENVKLVFKLWMHPNRSDENLRAIRNTVTSSDFYQSCVFYNENIVAPCVRESHFMGGMEKQVYDLLYGKTPIFGNFNFSAESDEWNDRKTIPATEVYLSCGRLTLMLRNWICNYKLDSMSAVQYMVDIWYQKLCIMKDKILIKKTDNITLLCKLIWYRKNSKEGLDKKLGLLPSMGFYQRHDLSENQLITVDKLYKIFEEQPLPGLVKSIWDDVKAIN